MPLITITELSRNNIEKALSLLSEGEIKKAVELSKQLSSFRTARLLNEVERETAVAMFKKMGWRRAARVFSLVTDEYAVEILKEMDKEEALSLIRAMRSDAIADLFPHLEENIQTWILNGLPENKRIEVNELVAYPEENTGAHMRTGFLAAMEGSTVAEIIQDVREAPEDMEHTAYIYVVNKQEKLIGVISTRELFLSDPKQKVEAVMRHVLAARVDDKAEDTAQLLRARRLRMLPVVNSEDILLGVVTIDSALELLSEEIAEDFLSMAGTSNEESFFTPARRAIRMRLPWMAGNIFLNLGVVTIISSFEETIAAVAILAAFLPMITDMGGNVGIQALTVSIRSIALGEAHLRDIVRSLHKEIVIGLCNGLALGIIFAIIAVIIQRNPMLGVVAGIALGTNVLVAGIVGGTMPFFIKRLGKDPALMTGPVLTTITDITGVTIYLGLCTLLLFQLMG